MGQFSYQAQLSVPALHSHAGSCEKQLGRTPMVGTRSGGALRLEQLPDRHAKGLSDAVQPVCRDVGRASFQLAYIGAVKASRNGQRFL
jgi:hypothetical protein